MRCCRVCWACAKAGEKTILMAPNRQVANLASTRVCFTPTSRSTPPERSTLMLHSHYPTFVRKQVRPENTQPHGLGEHISRAPLSITWMLAVRSRSLILDVFREGTVAPGCR